MLLNTGVNFLKEKYKVLLFPVHTIKENNVRIYVEGTFLRWRIFWGLFLFNLFFLLPASAPARAHVNCQCYNEERELKLTNPPLAGMDVSDLQLRMAQLGYYIGPINGIYDLSSAKAVSNFQQANGLIPSGRVVQSTWFVLNKGVKTVSSNNNYEPPVGKNLKVIIDTERLVLSLLIDGKVFNQYPIAIGKYNSPSPVGEWKIANKGYEAGGSFGTRWMGLNVPWGNYGIHGTNRPWSIGWPASAGCFRMHNEDIEIIYDWLSVGTPVVVLGTYTMPRGPLKPGFGSPEVIPLQTKLREKGFYIFGPADGDYGLMTELAVKEFQLYHGLKPTGSADAATLRLLNFHVFDPDQS